MRAVLTVAAVAAVSCGGSPARSPEPAGAAEEEERSPFAGATWREVMPAGATLLVGVDVPRLAASPAVRDLLPALSADAAELRRTLESAAAECGFAYRDDLGQVVLASFGPGEPNAVAVATGRFEADTVARCMDLLLALRGSGVERTAVGGMAALRGTRDGDNAWVAVPSEEILVLAGTRAWLGRTLDLGTPRLEESGSPLRELVASLPAERTLWAAGVLAADSEPARLAEGVAGAEMTAFYGYLELGEGLRAELGAVMESPEGASKIIGFLRSYLDSSQSLLEERGLASYAARLDLGTRGSIARVRLALGRAELERLVGHVGPVAADGGRP